jgi:hypothetical protein
MSRFKNRPDYIVNGDMSTATPPDARSTATVVGPWIPLQDIDSIGVQIKWPLSGTTTASTGTFGFEVTDDEDPTGNHGGMGPVAIVPTADMTAAAPAGGTSGKAAFTLAGQFFPRFKWGRGVYTRTSGGNATALQMAISVRGI